MVRFRIFVKADFRLMPYFILFYQVYQLFAAGEGTGIFHRSYGNTLQGGAGKKAWWLVMTTLGKLSSTGTTTLRSTSSE